MAVNRGYNNLIIESDSMMAIKLVSKRDIVFWDGSLVMYILDLAMTSESCQFQLVGRRENSIAHIIAKWDGQIGPSYVWESSLPTTLLILCNMIYFPILRKFIILKKSI